MRVRCKPCTVEQRGPACCMANLADDHLVVGPREVWADGKHIADVTRDAVLLSRVHYYFSSVIQNLPVNPCEGGAIMS